MVVVWVLLVSQIEQALGKQRDASDDELISSLVRLAKRVRAGRYRRNEAALSLARDLPRESEVARRVVTKLCGTVPPRQAEGEIAYFALALHGWLNNTM